MSLFRSLQCAQQPRVASYLLPWLHKTIGAQGRTKSWQSCTMSTTFSSALLRKGAINPLKQQVAGPKVPLYLLSSKIHLSSKNQLFEDNDTKAVTVWSNLREVKKSPMPALVLSLSGLIPFVACPAFMITSNLYLMQFATAQIAYGACILSFLGGVRWGFVIAPDNPVQPDWMNLGYSVMPAILAWTGLLLPQPMSLFTVMGGLVFAGFADMTMYGYPPWFKGLRFTLTLMALLSLWTTFMCSIMLPDQNGDKTSEE